MALLLARKNVSFLKTEKQVKGAFGEQNITRPRCSSWWHKDPSEVFMLRRHFALKETTLFGLGKRQFCKNNTVGCV